ncbi:MAG: RloB family protein [Candidatus Izemoplasmatales bacterium]
MARAGKPYTPKNKVLILTNGEHSEKNYFELLKSGLRTYYSVSVKFENADPVGLVEKAITLSEGYNRIWCVFDVDDFQHHGKVKEACELTRSAENVSVACSNRAFEVWLLNHFAPFRAKSTMKQLKASMTALLKKEQFGSGPYDKNDARLLENHFVPRYRQAAVNAKMMHQTMKREYMNDHPAAADAHIWELESATTVYQLVEFLINAKKQ